jgi:hypothetical protein
MLRAIVIAGCLTAAETAVAQPCTLPLQEQWAAATMDLQRSDEDLARQEKAGQRPDKAMLCKAAAVAQCLYDLALVYYPACEATTASRMLTVLRGRHLSLQRLCETSGGAKPLRD